MPLAISQLASPLSLVLSCCSIQVALPRRLSEFVYPHPAFDDPGAPLDPDGTDIGATLNLALRVLPAEGARRIIVLSDGAENRGDALAAARLVRAAGVAVDAVSLVPGRQEDVMVDQVQAPQEVHLGEVYDVRGVLRATVPAQASVALSRNGVVVATRRMALPGGETAITFRDKAMREDFACAVRKLLQST